MMLDGGAPNIEKLLKLPIWSGSPDFKRERVFKVLDYLGNPHDSIPAVHIGGTNGKGTTCSYVAAMLQAEGYKVGLTTSPHLSSVTERCVINGSPVSEEALDQTLSEIFSICSTLKLELSFFEMMIVSAFSIFREQQVDWMVVEVGLGGRHDATNVFRAPRVTAIASIGLDHTEILGPTVADIALEKAQIFKNDVPIFVGYAADEAKSVLRQVAKERCAEIEFVEEFFDYPRKVVRPAALTIPDDLHLVAKHQFENAALATRIAVELGVSDQAILDGLHDAQWPGRLERFELSNRTGTFSILLDAAHNLDGIESLCNYLTLQSEEQPISFILSFLSNREWGKMIDRLSKLKKPKLSWFLTTSLHPKAVDPEVMAKSIPNSIPFQQPEQALMHAIENAPPGSLTVIAGSIYLLGRLRPLLAPEPFSTLTPHDRETKPEPLSAR